MNKNPYTFFLFVFCSNLMTLLPNDYHLIIMSYAFETFCFVFLSNIINVIPLTCLNDLLSQFTLTTHFYCSDDFFRNPEISRW